MITTVKKFFDSLSLVLGAGLFALVGSLFVRNSHLNRRLDATEDKLKDTAERLNTINEVRRNEQEVRTKEDSELLELISRK